MKDRHIFLIGFMGTGKSTVGQALAEMLGWRFVDMDERLEKEEGITIPEIFAAYGEPHFRKLESRLLERIAGEERQVVSTGGGIVLAEANRELMMHSGFVAALKADAETIIERVRQDASRPLLRGNVEERVHRMLEERKHAYDFADCSVDTSGKTPGEIAASIVAFREEALRGRSGSGA